MIRLSEPEILYRTWYFSPSALLVTGIRIPSMSAYRAGVWWKTRVTFKFETGDPKNKEDMTPFLHQKKNYPHLSTIAGKLEFSNERNRSEYLGSARITDMLEWEYQT